MMQVSTGIFKSIVLFKLRMCLKIRPFAICDWKTGLIAHDKKFDFITQTQSLMNALSNITATDNQLKGICFF